MAVLQLEALTAPAGKLALSWFPTDAKAEVRFQSWLLLALGGDALFHFALITLAPQYGASTIPLIKAVQSTASNTAVVPLMAKQMCLGVKALP